MDLNFQGKGPEWDRVDRGTLYPGFFFFSEPEISGDPSAIFPHISLYRLFPEISDLNRTGNKFNDMTSVDRRKRNEQHCT